ncbi:MAG: methionyl-tRNA formyltransferase [Lachnospiraceae bacterium]|nr:methionyl-tRNA formyltransferase [Lachnospiraceae bacterium]
MRITWIGNHEEGVLAFRQTIERNGVDAFITLDDAAFAKRSAGSREYIEICEMNEIPVFPVDTIKSDKAREIISGLKPDLLVVFGWSEILPERILDIPAIGTVGTHASLLPHNRGSAPINWALIHGEETTGNTMMWLSREVDAGTIVDQMEIPITLFDTCRTLYKSVARTNAEMLRKLLDSLNSGVKPTSLIENRTDEALLPRRRPEDGRINWEKGAKELYDFIRALTKPYPGAFTFLDGKKYFFWEASVLPLRSEEKPGTILGTGFGFADNGEGICVSTKDHILWVSLLEDEEGIEYSNRKLYDLGLRGTFGDE